MQTSDTTKEISAALCAFQSAGYSVAKKGSNPAFKSRYATLSDILLAVMPGLSENGLSVTQFPDGEHGLTTRLQHVSGEYLQATGLMKPAAATPQAVGSALTYARRYALCAVLGLIVEDDDGHAASQAPAPVALPSAAPATDPLASDAQKNELRRVLDELDALAHRTAHRTTCRAMLHTLPASRADAALAVYTGQLAELLREAPNA